MNQPYEIVHSVHDDYRGLAGKMARIMGKSDVYWRSHGYEPKTANPNANGNASPVSDYMSYCELMQAAEPGAGRALNARIHYEMEMRFAVSDPASQGDIHTEIIDQNCDVQKWLASKDLSKASTSELAAFEAECDEAIESILAAKSKARAERRRQKITQDLVLHAGRAA